MNVDLAKICCRACIYGYDRMVGVAAHPAALLAIDESFIDTGTSCVLIVEQPDRRIVVFPGTQSEWQFLHEPIKTWDSILDWLHNLKFRLVSGTRLGCHGRLHRGFEEELHDLMPQLVAELQRRRDTLGAKPIVLTGHSQGGALAAIATAALPANGHEVSETFTFAAPRPGDYGFAESIKAGGVSVWRCEYGNDIVPHLPLRPDMQLAEISQNLLDYYAVGQLVYGKPNNNSFIVTDSAGMTHEQRRQRLLANQDQWLEHHHLDPHYLALLENLT